MVDIRPAQPADAQSVRRVHVEAFPTSVEADLVERLARDGDAVISLVALDGSAVVGHILFSRMAAEADGRRLRALGLAPVAVLPGRQRSGIGSRLIEAGLDRARSGGAEIVFVVGEPEYYGRFGFSADAARPFASPYAGPYFQALVLSGGRLRPGRGTADYAPAFADL